MPNRTSYKVSDNLFLVRQTQDPKAAPPAAKVEPSVNHIAVIDCSGSMWGELPKIRDQIKKRIPKLLKQGDTLSVIWFSGRNQFGALLEAEPVGTLTELKEVNNAIDRYLQCVGLTGFKEPIEEAKRLIARVSKKNSNPFALFFMSDGWDNQWSKPEILKAIEDTAAGLSSATIVEYGNYADRQLLAKMAEKAGGTMITAESFDKYAPIFEGAISKQVSGAPRVEIPIEGDPIGGFAFLLDAGDIITSEVNAGKVAVPEDKSELWYLSPTLVGELKEDLEVLAKMGLAA